MKGIGKTVAAFGLALCGGFFLESLRVDSPPGPVVHEVSSNVLQKRRSFEFPVDDRTAPQLAGVAAILAAEAEGLALSRQIAARRADASGSTPAPPPSPPPFISITVRIPSADKSVKVRIAANADPETVVESIAVRAVSACNVACMWYDFSVVIFFKSFFSSVL